MSVPFVCCYLNCSYGSDNQQGANWHPTRAFHMLRGEAIAWIFGLVLLETVHELQTQLSSKSVEAMRTGEIPGCMLLLLGVHSHYPYSLYYPYYYFTITTTTTLQTTYYCYLYITHILLLTLPLLPLLLLHLEYENFLTDLTPPLPNPKKCAYPYHCELRPLCFTDYQPHYSANLTLTELVVGPTQWEYDDG